MSTSGAEVSKTNSSRAAALAQLKFKRKKDVQPETTSRFFGQSTPVEPATPRVPRVLVPDSSPSAPHNINPPKQLPTGAWSTSRGLRDDSLSVPSFASTSSSSSSKHTNGSKSDVIDLDPDDGPPRKKPRPDLERIRSNASVRSDSSSVPPSSRVSVSSSTPTPVADDPLSPVVGKLRKEVSRVAVDSDSDADNSGQPARRRVIRGRRKQEDEDDLPSPRSLLKEKEKSRGPTLESDNDEREGIVRIRSSPPPHLVGGKLVNGKRVDSVATANGATRAKSKTSTPTPTISSAKPTPPPPAMAKPKPSKPLPKEKEKEKEEEVASSGTEFDASDGDEDAPGEWVADEATQRLEAEALEWFNEASEDALVEVTACTLSQAKIITSLRPFADIPFLKRALKRTKGVTQRYYDEYLNVQRGYSDVDSVLGEFDSIGRELAKIVGEWGANTDADDADAGLHLVTVPTLSQGVPTAEDPARQKALSYLIPTQPRLLASGVVLKDYQLFGISWLNLLYKRGLSCILADEMGLGKTCQVVAFLAYLMGGARRLDEDEDADGEVERERKGVHLVIVPSSTLENWAREFAKFAPSIRVATYYGSQKDRAGFRDEYKRSVRRAERAGVDKEDVDPGWDVLITTYQLAQGAELDRKFLTKSVKWETCVFDEGHVLKNFQSQRYQQLMKIQARWRLLLTGTPLQNNLQELVSLISFILPGKFTAETTDSLRTIFKTMMTPFVLRRRKDQVLKDLPNKTERIVWCSMTHLQRSIYNETMRRSKKELEREAAELAALAQQASASTTPDPEANPKKRPRATVEKKAKTATKQGANMKAKEASSAHVLMDLRKAASHPMLFRRRFDDAKVRLMARGCLKEPEFEESVEELVVEDMEVMTDAELQVFAKRYKSVRKYALPDDSFLDAGKVVELLKLLAGFREEGRRVLVFSQFTQILDILKVVLDHVSIRYLVLTGSTPVDERQSLVDRFTEDESIPVFLLSTRAGGMGINLTAASVVVMFDQDFNPHNDRQAADRSYRIGQKRDVDVVKLITKGTIEEDILRLGQTKLALDEAVAGDGEESGEGATEKAMKASLLTVLRERFADDKGTEDTGKDGEDMDLSN
ncbi:ATP-dependent DNA helicase [Ceratobasidium sp. AG-Ba]|nr:ATP-dependent DNA helicase [Ceratobasidium sp. AG-Ba]